jgi:protein SCO1/2
MSVSRRALAGRVQRLASTLAGKPIFWLVCIVTLLAFPILRSIHAEHGLPRSRPVLGRVRDFTLRDQRGGELGAAELRGRVWVASFTRVDGEPGVVSRRVMTTMSELRHRTRNLGDAIRLVTFTVDPDRDTTDLPSALSATYRVDHGSWRIVSGPTARVREVLGDFQVPETAPDSRLALVDADMLIRGYYDLADDAAVARLLRDVGLLLSLGK